jgi:hypothetical protein
MTKLSISLADVLYSAYDPRASFTDVKETVESAEGFKYKLDLDAALAEQCMVAIVWCVEDVQEVRPDLKKGQAWKVLQECSRVHDCELGFNWMLIQTVADDMFPRSRKGDRK